MHTCTITSRPNLTTFNVDAVISNGVVTVFHRGWPMWMMVASTSQPDDFVCGVITGSETESSWQDAFVDLMYLCGELPETDREMWTEGKFTFTELKFGYLQGHGVRNLLEDVWHASRAYV